MQLPYDENYKIDEGELRRFSARLAAIEGIAGLVPNGHTGEVFALTPAERAEVTRIVAGEVGGRPRGSSRKRLGTPRDRSMPLEDYSDSRSTGGRQSAPAQEIPRPDQSAELITPLRWKMGRQAARAPKVLPFTPFRLARW